MLGVQGIKNERIAVEVGLIRRQVGVWRRRWRDAWDSLCVWECTEPHLLREAILEVLSDAPRPGCPGKIIAAQVTQILAVACASPKSSGRPITRWTHTELRDEVVKRKIVEGISAVQVGRYLKQAALQLHRSKMWLNTTEKDPEKFKREAAKVCEAYLEAPRKAAVDGTHTVSGDEATSLQALERNAPDNLVQRNIKPFWDWVASSADHKPTAALCASVRHADAFLTGSDIPRSFQSVTMQDAEADDAGGLRPPGVHDHAQRAVAVPNPRPS